MKSFYGGTIQIMKNRTVHSVYHHLGNLITRGSDFGQIHRATLEHPVSPIQLSSHAVMSILSFVCTEIIL